MPRRRRASALEIAGGFVAVLCGVYLLQLLLPAPWGRLAILPRTESGLVGVLFAPLLHASVSHLVSNAAPLLVLLVVLFSDPRYRPEPTLAAIWLASGLGTWLIGRGGAIHLGASGLVFGLVSYLIASGFLMRTWRAAIVALAVFLLFGGIAYGLVPQPGPVSWEGHLCGALAGAGSAHRTHGRPRRLRS